MKYTIQLKNISKSFNSTPALNQINLNILEGQTTVLIGPSGCGKSTLLRIIIGLINSDTGTVSIEGTELSSKNVQEIRRNIGYVIQDGGLFPHLNAAQNVGLMAQHLGWDSDKIRNKIRELARLTKFPIDGLDRYPVQLSGGQKQRISLMRALILDPDILLFDEPLAALDPMIRYDLQNDLKNIFESLNKTVVLVTHDLSEASFFGHTIVLMKDGTIIQKGDIKDLLESPVNSFVTKFIQAQRHPINFTETEE